MLNRKKNITHVQIVREITFSLSNFNLDNTRFTLGLVYTDILLYSLRHLLQCVQHVIMMCLYYQLQSVERIKSVLSCNY